MQLPSYCRLCTFLLWMSISPEMQEVYTYWNICPKIRSGPMNLCFWWYIPTLTLEIAEKRWKSRQNDRKIMEFRIKILYEPWNLTDIHNWPHSACCRVVWYVYLCWRRPFLHKFLSDAIWRENKFPWYKYKWSYVNVDFSSCFSICFLIFFSLTGLFLLERQAFNRFSCLHQVLKKIFPVESLSL